MAIKSICNIIFLCYFITSACNALGNNDLNVITTKGPVEGKLVTTFNGKNVSAFLGIPYAKAPVGDLRFKAPVEMNAWTEPFKAHNRPIACTQAGSENIKITDNDWWVINENDTSEDCLFLNVWAPNPMPRNASVLVYIHGGAFEIGSSNSDKFQGQILASEQNVIVMSMNYRLAIFGHLYLGGEIDGNAALKDQSLALKWAKENIASFGGNPNDVTIFGVSAGGASVAYHLVLPTSKDLFKRALPLSGVNTASWAYTTKDVALKKYKDFAQFANCTNNETESVLECFRNMETKTLLKIIKEAPKTSLISFSPVVDGVYIPNIPATLMATGFLDKSKDIMIGETENEGGLIVILLKFLSLTEDSAPMTEQFTGLIKGLLGGNELLAKLIQFQYTNWTDPNNPIEIRKQAMNYFSDSLFTCSMNAVADFAIANGNKVYMYSFSHRISTSPLPKWTRSVHGDDQDFFFGWPLDSSNGFTAEEATLSKQIMTRMGNFAKTGNPNTEGLEKEEWPLYNAAEKPYLDVNSKPEVKYHNRAHHCAFWNQLLPDIYSVLGNTQASKCGA